jgi:hypothetical protein
MSEGTLAVPDNSQAAGSDSLPRILIIDDESAIRESLETLLSMEGYDVDSAENGELGLERIADSPSIWSCSTSPSPVATESKSSAPCASAKPTCPSS